MISYFKGQPSYYVLSYIPTKFKAGLHENIISANILNYNISANSKSGSITTSEVYSIVNKDGTSPNRTF